MHFNRIHFAWTGRFFVKLLCVAIWCGATLAQVPLPPDRALQGAQPEQFGSVWRIQGSVSASPATKGNTRSLKVGDPVYVGERLQTDALGEAVFKTLDSGYVALRPGAALTVDRFAADGKTTDNFTVNVIKGGLRLVTGWIGKVNPMEYRVLTPTSTIGIRGTDHEPYVLTEELAQTLAQPPGTYDKVNRGGTRLAVDDKFIDIDPGQVGFSPLTKPMKTRALMTLVLPVLLEKVPAFFVPGMFDSELDGIADAAAVCHATVVARSWIEQLDNALARSDAPTVLGMFAPSARVEATVLNRDGSRSGIAMAREEFAGSAIAAMRSLTDYSQRRLFVTGTAENGSDCKNIAIQSLVLEQGKQAGKFYRFESWEEFALELRGDRWLATKATTQQR